MVRIAFLLIFLPSLLIGQHKKPQIPIEAEVTKNAGIPSGLQTCPLYREIVPKADATKWAVSLQRISSHAHELPGLDTLKHRKTVQKRADSKQPEGLSEQSSSVPRPTLGQNFDANWTLVGTPPDNHLAISNGGLIVTVNNDGIEYYRENGNFLYFDYWSDFFTDPNLNSVFYDPRIIYDSGADRFIMVVLHGNTSFTSRVMLCFSQTNDPRDGWYTYDLTGDPLSDNSWFDYPNLGISDQEVYVTGNLFSTGGNNFNEAVIYQIPKNAGYAGGALNWQYWQGLDNLPYPAFTLVPASYGRQGNYGPGVYLVSNSFSGSNRIRLWDLTDYLGNNPVLNAYTVNTSRYSPAGDAFQLGSNDQLSNGDCRIQNAFYLDTVLHFVFHSEVGNSGWNGVNYNRLRVDSRSNKSALLGSPNAPDYSYPSIASLATQPGDKSVIAAFLSSSSSIYPEIRVAHCDDLMQWSNSTLVKSGENYVDLLGSSERWGDYADIARKQNSTTPTLWVAGSYGADIPGANAFNTYMTRLAMVSTFSTFELPENESPQLKVFPNPTYDLFQVEFEAADKLLTEILIVDLSGKPVKLLFEGYPKAGLNRFSFNRAALSSGTYFLIIRSENEVLKREKLVVVD